MDFNLDDGEFANLCQPQAERPAQGRVRLNATQKLLLAEDIDWNAVTERAREHPNELVVRRGETIVATILHDMIPLKPPTEALRAVIDGHPEALVENIDGSEALKLACERQASYNVIRTIVEGMCFHFEFDPFEFLSENGFWDPLLPIPTMRVILEELPLASDEMDYQDAHALAKDLLSKTFMSNRAAFWEKLNLILMKLSMGVTSEEQLDANGRTFLILHSFLKLISKSRWFERNNTFASDHLTTIEFYEVPPMVSRQMFLRALEHDHDPILQVLKLVKELVPQQFQIRDGNGNLPLHIAATFAIRRGGYTSGRASSVINLLIDFLLGEYPEAVSVADGQGRLALQIALENGSPCWRRLANAEPRAIDTRDVQTRMYPFQMVAMESVAERRDYQKSNGSVDDIYFLLRKAPHVLKQYSADDDAKLNSQEFLEYSQSKLAMEQSKLQHEQEMTRLQSRYEMEQSRLSERSKVLKRKLDETFG